jgi:hypothetical protein
VNLGAISGTVGTAVAVLAGPGAACSFGVGVALQYRQAQLAPATERTPIRLLAHLARQRQWLAGNALAAGYGFQVPPCATRVEQKRGADR